MIKRNQKIIFALIALLYLDILKPLNYGFSVEYLFLGIIFLFLNYPVYFGCVLACCLGYLKESLSFAGSPLSIIEFALIIILGRIFLSRFHAKGARPIVALSALAVHVVINAVSTGTVSLFYWLEFFVHSCIIFLAINHILRKWASILPVKYI